jgi:hypothetical protein
MQPSTNFIVVETQDQSDNNRYTSIEICNTSGTTLETVSLTGEIYDNRNDEFLGSTKYCVIYSKYDDNNVDYKIIHYNGETETLTQTSHVKSSNFSNYNIQGDGDFWPNDSGEKIGGVVITLYNNISYSNIGTVVSYCDIIYMLDNQTTFNTYTAADDTQIEIQTYGQLSNIFRTRINTGGFFEILTISTTGGTITTTDISTSSISNINDYFLGDKTIYNILTNDNNYIDSLLIDEDGSIIDRVSRTLNSQYSYSMDSQGKLGYLRIETSEGNEAYYVYGGSTEFTSTDSYSNTRTPGAMYSDTALEPEAMVLYSEGGSGFRFLSTTGITSDLQFPSFNGRQFEVGNTMVMCVYQDTISNATVIDLYNFSGQLLKSHKTVYNGWNDAYAIGDRFFVKFNGGEGNEFFLVSEETITSVVLDSYDSDWAPNDIIWWYDY